MTVDGYNKAEFQRFVGMFVAEHRGSYYLTVIGSEARSGQIHQPLGRKCERSGKEEMSLSFLFCKPW